MKKVKFKKFISLILVGIMLLSVSTVANAEINGTITEPEEGGCENSAHIWASEPISCTSQCGVSGEAVFKCENCDATICTDYPPLATEHYYVIKEEVTVDGETLCSDLDNCEKDGIIYKECLICGDVISETLPQSGHCNKVLSSSPYNYRIIYSAGACSYPDEIRIGCYNNCDEFYEDITLCTYYVEDKTLIYNTDYTLSSDWSEEDVIDTCEKLAKQRNHSLVFEVDDDNLCSQNGVTGHIKCNRDCDCDFEFDIKNGVADESTLSEEELYIYNLYKNSDCYDDAISPSAVCIFPNGIVDGSPFPEYVIDNPGHFLYIENYRPATHTEGSSGLVGCANCHNEWVIKDGKIDESFTFFDDDVVDVFYCEINNINDISSQSDKYEIYFLDDSLAGSVLYHKGNEKKISDFLEPARTNDVDDLVIKNKSYDCDNGYSFDIVCLNPQCVLEGNHCYTVRNGEIDETANAAVREKFKEYLGVKGHQHITVINPETSEDSYIPASSCNTGSEATIWCEDCKREIGKITNGILEKYENEIFDEELVKEYCVAANINVHNNTTWKLTTPATCKNPGIVSLVCDDCEKELAIAENIKQEKDKFTYDITSLDPDDKYEETEIPKICLEAALILDHTYEEIEDTATCTEDGVKKYKCSQCEKTKEEPSEAKGHDYKFLTSKESTCNIAGYDSNKCSICGDIQNIPRPLLEHKYTLAETLEPTESATGYRKYKCDNCEAVKTEVIAKKQASEKQNQTTYYTNSNNTSDNNGNEEAYWEIKQREYDENTTIDGMKTSIKGVAESKTKVVYPQGVTDVITPSINFIDQIKLLFTNGIAPEMTYKTYTHDYVTAEQKEKMDKALREALPDGYYVVDYFLNDLYAVPKKGNMLKINNITQPIPVFIRPKNPTTSASGIAVMQQDGSVKFYVDQNETYTGTLAIMTDSFGLSAILY